MSVSLLDWRIVSIFAPSKVMNDGPGFTWNEVKKQIKDRYFMQTA